MSRAADIASGLERTRDYFVEALAREAKEARQARTARGAGGKA